MTTRRRIAATALGLGAIALLAWGLWAASRPIPEALQGQMEAQETDIAPKLSARITEVLVREGQPVRAGDVLLRTDSPEVRAKLAQAEAAQAAAQAQADKAAHGARRQEVEMARLQWQRAEAAATLADQSFRRVNNLAREGLVAQQKRDEALANQRASREAARAARAQYDMAREGARPEDRAAADAQVRRAEGAVAEVQAAQAETELRSPVAGEVAKVLARAGELSPQGVPVVTVVDLNDQWVVLNVREDQLQRFAMGAEFDAELPALPAEPGGQGGARQARFQVTYSAALPHFATWRATRADAGFDARTFEVRARPVQPIDGARPGMTVRVK